TGRYRLPELPRDVVLSTPTASARRLRHAALARELAGRAGDEAAERPARRLRAAGPMAPDMSPQVTATGITPHPPHLRSPR
ncbi:MAG: transcriptional regulator, partial [Streptomyces sp.]|nr:transcriptional regulator [Streptomyces sp.]